MVARFTLRTPTADRVSLDKHHYSHSGITHMVNRFTLRTTTVDSLTRQTPLFSIWYYLQGSQIYLENPTVDIGSLDKHHYSHSGITHMVNRFTLRITTVDSLTRQTPLFSFWYYLQGSQIYLENPTVDIGSLDKHHCHHSDITLRVARFTLRTPTADRVSLDKHHCSHSGITHMVARFTLRNPTVDRCTLDKHHFYHSGIIYRVVRFTLRTPTVDRVSLDKHHFNNQVLSTG